MLCFEIEMGIESVRVMSMGTFWMIVKGKYCSFIFYVGVLYIKCVFGVWEFNVYWVSILC